MTLEEMKKKTLRLIEEISDSETFTDDPDIEAKLNDVINQIQFELCRIKKISAYKEIEVEKDQVLEFKDIDDRTYQIDIVQGIDADLRHKRVICNEEGTAKIYYYVYPEAINYETPNTYKFELDEDVLNIMPYGIAADLLKSDVSNNYGQIYANRYNELKQGIDPRNGMYSGYIDGGIDI